MTKSNILKLRSEHNYDRDAVSRETALHFEDPSRAQKHMLKDTDINVIVGRFHKTGILPQGLQAPSYGDFEGIFDYADAVNAIARAGETFDQLPSKVRARFHNNPQEFVEFCSDEANLAEIEKMGLTAPKMQIQTEVINTPSSEETEPKSNTST
jgi:phage internal scaffolding protein